MKPFSKEIAFASGKHILKGVLHLPDCKYPPVVVGSHGLEGSKNSPKQIRLSTILPLNGIAFLRFDHRGCGNSGGNFVDETSLDKRAHDLVSAINYLRTSEKTSKPICLFGSSFGGSACIAAWQILFKMNVKLSGCVLCAAPVDSSTIKVIPSKSENSRPRLPLRFYRENLNFNITEKIKEINNILVFHGDCDEVVPFVNGYIIYQNAKKPKKLMIFKDGDHRMSSQEDQIIFENESLKWFNRCFTDSEVLF